MQKQSKSQRYSASVFTTIQQYVTNPAYEQQRKEKYKILCKRSGGLLRTMGLIQFLTYLQAKGQKEFNHKDLLDHLRSECCTLVAGVKGQDEEQFLKNVRNYDLPIYMQVTREVLLLLRWHKQISDVLIKEPVDVHGGE